MFGRIIQVIFWGYYYTIQEEVLACSGLLVQISMQVQLASSPPTHWCRGFMQGCKSAFCTDNSMNVISRRIAGWLKVCREDFKGGESGSGAVTSDRLSSSTFGEVPSCITGASALFKAARQPLHAVRPIRWLLEARITCGRTRSIKCHATSS